MGHRAIGMKIVTVVGARPNFMKAAPLCRAVSEHNRGCPRQDRIHHVLVHTGQHYDPTMSGRFFQELGLPEPDHNLGVGPGSQADQVGRALIALEPMLGQERPDWVVVVGDVNASLSATLAAKKLLLKVAHIEAGLRSNDWTMPEEINRIMVDRVADLLLAPTQGAVRHLLAEGTDPARIDMVGNIMIDTLDDQREAAMMTKPAQIIRAHRREDGTTAAPPEQYALLTLHRPGNVDQPEMLHHAVMAIARIARHLPVVFPVHPRTLARLEENGLYDMLARCEGVHLLSPLGYVEMLGLSARARAIVTDSGGLQEEAMVLGVPCLTLRTSTERPETLIEHGGTNTLVGTNPAFLEQALLRALGSPTNPVRPPLWDGRAAHRIVRALLARRDAMPYRTGLSEFSIR